MLPTSMSLQSSEQLAFGDVSSRSAASGQHGQILTLQLGGKGNTASPSLSDGTKSVPWYVWAALAAGGVVLALILKKKN